MAVSCDLTFEEIFLLAKGKYKLLLKLSDRNKFVCFSPETFVRIKSGKIYSYPMKGTLDASIPNAKEVLMNDDKEADITLQDLKKAQSIRLFNAMIEFGEMEVPIQNLHF